MKVGLLQAPVWWTIDPPLGLAQMAGCLKAAGHEVKLWDLNIRLWSERPPQYENMWLWEQYHFWNRPEVVDRFFADNAALIDRCVEEVLASDVRAVGFSLYAGTHLASLKMAARIKQADPKRWIVFGGQYFFLGGRAAEVMKEPCVDVVVKGAGEDVFTELVADIERSGAPRPRPGLVIRGAEGLLDGGVLPPVRDLDKLPFPDFTGFPMELYSDQTRIPIAGSRGCVWKCRFCSTTEFWDGYSYMSGDRIFAEVQHQKSLFPHRAHFEFYDITANGKPESMRRFAELAKGWIIQHRPERNFRWKINAILRPEMTAELLKLMYEGGCQDIIYGVESGSPRVLKKMNKHFDIEVASRVLKDTHDAGIHTTGNFMFGFPGETEEDFRLTLDFLEANKDWLERAYGSATFTSLEEFAYLTEHQEDFGIKRETGHTAHNLYWESADGQNTYPVRLDRYKRFRETCIRLGIDAYKGVNGTLDQDHVSNLAQYHQYKDDRLAAIRSFLEYMELDLMNEPIRRQLQVYQRDLRLLLRASRLVDKANAGMASLNGHSGSLLAEVEALSRDGRALPWPAASAAADLWVRRYLARAQRLLGLLQHRGLLKIEDGRFRLYWEQQPVPPSMELSGLQKRVDIVISLAESEARRPPQERHVPGCAR